ncbi:efflux transporter outer membrane subunit [Desulfobacula phenolica]|uniref:Efflux transporter, outer membrane factor (OMF) lipoprotein, NodT family n=1 Tax=Desulfobacula phenolica TaxID=90732 RepID=A0A1H2F876_9BACT|nr:efflux transporter outer membrane subunit [Desulfobacula phenolica]SDU03571.1 efflux transporter, outer membrane factor (OMF) lipoprotein, NodT family [Desulfobacula phenolica]
MKSVFFVMLASVVIFSGCKTLKPEPGTLLSLKIPDRFSVDAGDNDSIVTWWFLFESDELTSLINHAVDHNFDLKILKTKVIQAKANLEKEEASFFPELGFSFGGQKKETRVKNTYSSPSDYDGSHSWDGSLRGAYNLDVWGQANAGKQVEILSLKAAEQDLKFSTLELTAQIAENWIDIIAARHKKSILGNQIKINNTLLELQTLRFVNGKANALDVSQQREVLAEANSQLPLLEKQEKLLLNNLAFLSGKTDLKPVEMTTKILPDPLPLPKVGIPSDLLENRPDIQAAGMRLSSGQWEITAARADRLPSFDLTAQALFSSGKLDLLFNNWVATLAGSIAGPILDGGLRKAEIKRLKAVADEQLTLYARTVAKAIVEVEDSLVSIDKQAAYIRLLEEELAVARLTLKDAGVQYQNGQSSYLAYLTAWTHIEQLERKLVGERAALIKERIGLYRALGWNPIPGTT